MRTETYQHPTYKFYIEDDIAYGTFLLEKYDLEEARSVFKFRYSIIGDRPLLWMIDGMIIRYMSREARMFFSSPQNCKGMIACAAVHTGTPVQMVITNMILNFNKPPMPFKIFTNKEKAMCWLRRYKKM